MPVRPCDETKSTANGLFHLGQKFLCHLAFSFVSD